MEKTPANKPRRTTVKKGANRRRQAEKQLKRALLQKMRRAPLLVLLVAAALAVAITVSEKMGGPLPTWSEIYAGAGLSRLDGLPQEATEASTKIHFIDVGQGLATLIEQDGAFCLIDAGTPDSAEDLVGYLQEAGVKTLDLLVMTHPHADHIGGMVKVLETFEVKQAILPDFSKAPKPDTYTTLRTLELIDTQGIPDATARPGDVYSLGSGTLTIVDTGVQTEDYNDISVVTLFEAPGVQFLGTGDAERKQWNDMLQKDTVPRANLYGASHHGSASANPFKVLDVVRPRAVVVSCEKGNSYGHPHKEALQSFADVNAAVYRTDESGSIVAYVDTQGALKLAPARAGAQVPQSAPQSAVEFPASSQLPNAA